MHPALSIRALAKRYHCGLARWASTVEVLRGVDLDVAPGELVAVVGTGGAGKSTLLLCAAGLLAPDAGTIRWFGASLAPIARPGGIAYVPQRCPYHRLLTVREALELHAALDEVPGRDRSRRVWAALERVGLDSHGDETVARLGPSSRRRLAIAQALIGHPRLVLLDEPADAAAGGETDGALSGVLAGMRRAGCAVVSAVRTHRAAAGADRIVALVDGRLSADTAPAIPSGHHGARGARVAEAEARSSR